MTSPAETRAPPHLRMTHRSMDLLTVAVILPRLLLPCRCREHLVHIMFCRLWSNDTPAMAAAAVEPWSRHG